MAHLTADSEEQFDLLAWEAPQVGILDEILALRKRWVEVLGYEPWDSPSHGFHIHKQGWCLDGYTGRSFELFMNRRQKSEKIGLPFRKGFFWITEVNQFDTTVSKDAYKYVKDRFLETRSAVYGIPLMIHDINQILVEAREIRY